MYAGERFNSISHLVGAALALIGVSVLVTLAGIQGGALRIVTFSVYGATLFLLYLVSTLYHSLRGRAKRVFKILDHDAIYPLIAGTYTPFSLLVLQGKTGWWMFGAIWTLAVIGILIDSLSHRGRRILPMIIYLRWVGSSSSPSSPWWQTYPRSAFGDSSPVVSSTPSASSSTHSTGASPGHTASGTSSSSRAASATI